MKTTFGLTYLQPMQCEDCGSIIQIEEQERNTITVNAKGLPVDSEVTKFAAIGKCPRCGRLYEVEKDGMYFSLYNRTFALCPNLKLKQFIEDENLKVGFGWEV